MSNNTTYKDSPLGKIPNGWEDSLLDNLTKRGSGHTPNKDFEEYYNGGIKWISLADSYRLDNGLICETDNEISDLGIKNSSAVLHPAGTVLLSRDAGVGKSAVMGIDMAVSQHFITWTCKEELDNWFLYYWLQYKKEYFERQAVGSTIKTIGLPLFKKLIIKHPKYPEQKAIASLLTTWDTALKTTQSLIDHCQLRKKWLMQQLLTGKKRLKGFSGEWKEWKLGELVDKNKRWSFTGGPFGSNLKAEDYTIEGIRIIQLQNIGDGFFNDDYKIYTSEEKADELLSCNIYPGEIIISKMGDPVARACFMPSDANRYLMASDGIRLAIDETRFNKKFVHDYINFDLFRKKAIESSTGSTRQRIGLDDLKRLTLLMPSITEQTAIAQVLQTADKEIQLLKAKVEKLKEQKQGLMQVLLTGKKRLII